MRLAAVRMHSLLRQIELDFLTEIWRKVRFYYINSRIQQLLYMIIFFNNQKYRYKSYAKNLTLYV